MLAFGSHDWYDTTTTPVHTIFDHEFTTLLSPYLSCVNTNAPGTLYCPNLYAGIVSATW